MDTHFGRGFVPQRPPEFVGRFLIPIFLSGRINMFFVRDHRPSAVLRYCARENAAHFCFSVVFEFLYLQATEIRKILNQNRRVKTPIQLQTNTVPHLVMLTDPLFSS